MFEARNLLRLRGIDCVVYPRPPQAKLPVRHRYRLSQRRGARRARGAMDRDDVERAAQMTRGHAVRWSWAVRVRAYGHVPSSVSPSLRELLSSKSSMWSHSIWQPESFADATEPASRWWGARARARETGSDRRVTVGARSHQHGIYLSLESAADVVDCRRQRLVAPGPSAKSHSPRWGNGGEGPSKRALHDIDSRARGVGGGLLPLGLLQQQQHAPAVKCT